MNEISVLIRRGMTQELTSSLCSLSEIRMSRRPSAKRWSLIRHRICWHLRLWPPRLKNYKKNVRCLATQSMVICYIQQHKLRQMDKQNVDYIHTIQYYSATKRNEILIYTTTWINLEDTMLSEMSQTQKNKYYMISLIWEVPRVIRCRDRK